MHRTGQPITGGGRGWGWVVPEPLNQVASVHVCVDLQVGKLEFICRWKVRGGRQGWGHWPHTGGRAAASSGQPGSSRLGQFPSSLRSLAR